MELERMLTLRRERLTVRQPSDEIAGRLRAHVQRELHGILGALLRSGLYAKALGSNEFELEARLWWTDLYPRCRVTLEAGDGSTLVVVEVGFPWLYLAFRALVVGAVLIAGVTVFLAGEKAGGLFVVVLGVAMAVLSWVAVWQAAARVREVVLLRGGANDHDSKRDPGSTAE